MPTKVSKEFVSYTDSGSPAEHCSLYAHYFNPTTCSRVVGRIRPEGWCELFEKRKGTV